jgi:hypothetical protein
MNDFMLRTITEAQMDDALEAAGLLVEQDMGGGELKYWPITKTLAELNALTTGV